YYNNGILAWEALKSRIDIYDGVLQNSYLQKLVPDIKLEKIFYSQYPPYLFVLNMPLPLIEMKPAWVLFELGGLAGIVFSVYGLLKNTIKGRFSRWFAFIATLASFPCWVCFRLGQIALFIYPFFIWYFISLKEKKWFRAGILGGICLLKPQYAPIMFLTGLFLGKGKFLIGYTISGLVYLIASILVLGLDNVVSYPRALKYGEISGETTGVSPEAQQNIRGQLVALFHNDGSEIHLVSAACWLIASLFMGYLWWREAKKQAQTDNQSENQRRFMILSSITVLVLLVTSPHTHRQDYIFVSLPSIWLIYSMVGNFPLEKPPYIGTYKAWQLLSLRYLILGFPGLSWIFFLATSFLPVVIQPFFVWALIMLTCVSAILKNQANETNETEGVEKENLPRE
ncbi:MAG: DUF2029 domain-containing protein, partial [Candidatus Obscuribacterales bacterium]|nr:DUF2029 domain-containing protein [Candidatus Obscuribacterales bacterium]